MWNNFLELLNHWKFILYKCFKQNWFLSTEVVFCILVQIRFWSMIKSTNQKAVRTEQQVVWRIDNRSVKNALNKTIVTILMILTIPIKLTGSNRSTGNSWRSLQFIPRDKWVKREVSHCHTFVTLTQWQIIALDTLYK